MSNDALGWVYRHSPLTGAAFAVHAALGDSANDQHDYELWMTQKTVAAKARVSVKSVRAALDQLEELGLAEYLEGGKEVGTPTRYVLLLPDGWPVVFETRKGRQNRPTPGRQNRPTGSAESTQGGRQNRPTPLLEPKLVTQPEPKLFDAKAPKTAKVGVPEDFTATDEMRDWARANAPTVNADAETAKFVDYWRGRGEKRADWTASWRYWMRNAVSFGRGKVPAAAHPNSGWDRNEPDEVMSGADYMKRRT